MPNSFHTFHKGSLILQFFGKNWVTTTDEKEEMKVNWSMRKEDTLLFFLRPPPHVRLLFFAASSF